MAGRDDYDYVHTPVPGEETTPAWRIALIIIGGTIAVPGFLMAAQISAGAGFQPALVGFIIGCQVLGLTGIVVSRVGVRSKLSTYMILQFPFGRRGAKFPSLLIGFVLFFWFAILCGLLGAAAAESMRTLLGFAWPEPVLAVAGGLAMVLITIYGFSAVTRMSMIVVPIMAAVLLYGAWRAWQVGDHALLAGEGTGVFGISAAISAVIGAYSGGIVTLPDYLRYARNPGRALAAVYFALAISFPTVLTITALPSILFGKEDLINIMLALGIGVGALIVLIFSTVSSNVGLLYSSGLALATATKKVGYRGGVILLGILASALSAFDILSLFIPYISLLGISIPSLCAIYMCDFYLVRKGDYSTESLLNHPDVFLPGFVGWTAGFVGGLVSHFGWVTLTTVTAVDSMIVAGGVYTLIARRRS
ncbi:cytosine permease [Elongatibacter sediminis]|uniref:Cytosine permease n=1 Tax=Elongatibacter sediminis TaxID=3119006 RepID=A0AAW9RBS5_9GAMM